MRENKTLISNASTYEEIGEFWDSHDLGDYWDQTEPAQFEIDLQTESTYYRLDRKLAVVINEIARQRGVSPETLLNLWIQEKLQDQSGA